MQHTDYDNFGGVKRPRGVGSKIQRLATVHVRILKQDPNAWLQLPTSLKMPSGQGDQNAIAAHYTPEELADKGVHTVKIPQNL